MHLSSGEHNAGVLFEDALDTLHFDVAANSRRLIDAEHVETRLVVGHRLGMPLLARLILDHDLPSLAIILLASASGMCAPGLMLLGSTEFREQQLEVVGCAPTGERSFRCHGLVRPSSVARAARLLGTRVCHLGFRVLPAGG